MTCPDDCHLVIVGLILIIVGLGFHVYREST